MKFGGVQIPRAQVRGLQIVRYLAGEKIRVKTTAVASTPSILVCEIEGPVSFVPFGITVPLKMKRSGLEFFGWISRGRGFKTHGGDNHKPIPIAIVHTVQPVSNIAYQSD